MKQLKLWVGQNWRSLVVVAATGMFFLFLYGFHINSLTHGLSPIEATYVHDNSYISHIGRQPVFWPHKLLTFFASAARHDGTLARLPSVILIIGSIGCFYTLAR